MQSLNDRQTALAQRGIVIRPAQPGDVALYKELFDTLSDDSIHQRFCIALNAPPRMVLEWFDDPDKDRKAFVAVQQFESRERMLGIARLLTETNPCQAEFAVLVGDPWQGQGIGSALMRRCLDATRELGIRKVRGVAMPQNTRMIALAKDLGFSVRLAPKARMVVMEWDANW